MGKTETDEQQNKRTKSIAINQHQLQENHNNEQNTDVGQVDTFSCDIYLKKSDWIILILGTIFFLPFRALGVILSSVTILIAFNNHFSFKS